METITIKNNDARPLMVRPKQADGTSPDLMGAQAQIRIAEGSTCLLWDGVVSGELFEFDREDIDLRNRAYRASIYFDWGQGWEYQNDFVLHVQGGC